jgi:hypothetical protein
MVKRKVFDGSGTVLDLFTYEAVSHGAASCCEVASVEETLVKAVLADW